VSTAEQVKQLNSLLVAFSLAYLGAAAVLLRVLSTPGLILANCLSMRVRSLALIRVSDMLLRIARSGTVIAAYLRARASPTLRLPLREFFPSYALRREAGADVSDRAPVVLCFLASAVATHASRALLGPLSLKHLLVGVACLAPTGLLV
jgi:hypothetical protein